MTIIQDRFTAAYLAYQSPSLERAEDVALIRTVALNHGLRIGDIEAIHIWEWYSESRFAGWLMCDDDGARDAIDEFITEHTDMRDDDD